MNNFNRWLSILMCLCLLGTSVFGDVAAAIAEADPVTVIETVPSQAESAPEGGDVLSAESGQIAENADAPPVEDELILELVDEEPVVTEEPVTAEPVVETEHTDYTADASQLPEFVFGYAELLEDAKFSLAYESDAAAVLAKYALVLVVDRRNDGEADQVCVMFECDGAVVEGWMDAVCVRPMSEEEVGAYQDGVTEALCYADDVNFPLPVNAMQPVAVGEEETSDEQSAENNETEKADENTDSVENVDSDAENAPEDVVVPENEPVEDVPACELTFEEETLFLEIGQSAFVAAIVSDDETHEVTYHVKDAGVVVIDENGNVSAVAEGTTEIEAVCGVHASSAVLEVVVDVAQPGIEIEQPDNTQPTLTVAPETMEMMVGENAVVTGTLTGSEEAVTYSTNNEKVATVDAATGTVTAVGKGVCTITAKAGESLSAACKLTVYAVAETFDAAFVSEMDAGSEAKIEVTHEEYTKLELEYTSSDVNVATVDANGLVKAVKGGKCVITVSNGKTSKEFALTVYDALTDFAVEISKSELNEGEIALITVECPEFTRGEPSFASRNEAVAKVDANGVVTAVAYGECELVVTVGDIEKTVKAVVYRALESFDFTMDAELEVGYRSQIALQIPEYTREMPVKYASSDASVATVSADGLVKAVGAGECKITVTIGGVSVTKDLTVMLPNVELNATYLELGIDETFTLKPLEVNFGTLEEGYTFESSNPEIASVDADTGVIKAVAEGKAIVTVHLVSGEQAICHVNVSEKATKAVITKVTKTVGVGQITDPMEVALYAGEKLVGGSVTFKSSNTNYVQVNALGQIKGIRAGKATVTATAGSGVSAAVTITVKAAPSTIYISPAKASLAVGQTGKISYSLPGNTAAGVTFTSGNTEIATVDQSGNVTAVKEGIVNIAVRTHNGKQRVCAITVKKAPENVSLTLSAQKLGVDMTATASAAVDTTSNVAFTYNFYTDRPDIVSVDAATGKITAKAVGEANIFVKAYNGVNSQIVNGERVVTSAKVTVVDKPDGIVLPGAAMNAIVGKVFTLPVTFVNDEGKECLATYTLKSNNTRYVAVNSAGQVKGVRAGYAWVTVTTSNGLSASVKIVVRKAPTSVALTTTNLVLGETMQSTMKARVYFSGGNVLYSPADEASLGKFSSSNPEIVTIDKDGLVTALKPGKAVITFKTYNGKYRNCNVTVKAKPTAVYLDKEVTKLGVGMSQQLVASYKENELGITKFTSKNPEIAEVTEDGLITAKAVGTATIVGTTTQNNCTAECIVTVVDEPDGVIIEGGNTINAYVGKIFKLPVQFTHENDEECLATYTLKSNNTRYVAVNSAGQVKGVRAGYAWVTVTTSNGLTTSCKVVVKKAPTKVALSANSMTLGEGMTGLLQARVYYSGGSYIYNVADQYSMGTFTSSNPDVATIDAAGNIEAKLKGETTLTFKTLNGKYRSMKLTVLAKPTAVYVSPETMKLGVGMTGTVSASYKEGELGVTKYSTEDTDIIEVTEDGKITAKAVGTATVIGTTTENNCTDTCVVTVVDEPDGVIIEGGNTINAYVGKIFKLPVQFTHENGEECLATYTLKSNNTRYVAVNSAGQVKGVRAGYAWVTVTTSNGLTTSCKVVVKKAPTKVALSANSMTLGEGMTGLLQARVYYSGGSYIYNVADQYSMGTFTSSNPDVATIDAAGNIEAKLKGETTLTFKTLNGKYRSMKLTVLAKPTAVYVSPETMKLGVGMTGTVSASYKDGELGVTKYSTEDTDIIEVTEDGKITAKAVGTATVVGTTTENKCTDTCVVTVVDEPDGVIIEGGNTINTYVGKIFKLPVQFTYENDEECLATYTLKSNNTRYVAVNSAGQVKGVRAGYAWVTVTTSNGLTTSCKVVVKNAPTGVALSANSMTLGEGMTGLLQARVYYSGGNYVYNVADQYSMGTFTSSNPDVATIDAAGNIEAKLKGETTLTFKTLNGKYKSMVLTVYAKPTAVYLEKNETMLGVGMTEALAVSFNDYELGEVEYASDKDSVVTVDENGVMTAVGEGTANVTATSNGHTATCAVRVVPGPDAILVPATSINLPVGKTMTLAPVASYEGSTENCAASYTYATSNKNIVAVNAAGLIKGMNAGSAKVRIKAQNDTFIDLTINVRKAPTKVVLSAPKVSLGIGQTYSLQARIYFSGGNFLYSSGDSAMAIYESSNPDVATVDNTGRITALREGSANIRMRTYNGKSSGYCVVTVVEGTQWLEFEDQNVSLSVEQSKTLRCDKSAGSLTTRTYVSDNPGIVKVEGNDATCTVTGVSCGTATITATSSNGVTTTCVVTVYAKPEVVEFEQSAMTIGETQIVKLPGLIITSSEGECVQSVTYASGNSSVAKVSADGYVTGVKAGTVKITAETYDGQKATCTVTVTAAPTKITVKSDSDKLAVTESTQLHVTMDHPGEYSFDVSEPSIVKIDADGVVTALKPGKVVVTATTYNGIDDTCEIEVMKLPESVTLDVSRLTLGVGMSQVLTASVPEDSLGVIVYRSSDNNIAEVDADGNIVAKSIGSARITAYVSGHEEVFDTCELTVLAMPDSIALSADELAVKTGASVKLTATPVNAAGDLCHGTVEFRSEDADIAMVSETGVITGHSNGTTKIIAIIQEDESIEAVCTVTVADAKVYLDVSELTLGQGETYKLKIHMPFGEDNLSIVSDKSEFASVDEAGVITAVAPGTASITVTNGGETAVCVVTVMDKPQSVVLAANEKQLVEGDTFVLNAVVQPEGAASRLEYDVDDAGVLSVSENGVVTALSAGTATVTVSTYLPGVAAECVFTVVHKPDMIRFGEVEDIVLAKGDTYVLEKPVMYSAKGVCDSWYTLAVSNADCASISLNEEGGYVINALETGVATLRLKTENGKTASRNVVVVEAPASIAFAAETLGIGLNERFAPVVTGDNGAVVAVKLSSENPAVASISEDGSIVGETAGETTVTATSVAYPGLTAQVRVKVDGEPDGMTMTDACTMGVNETVQLSVSFASGAAAGVTFASSDETVAQVGKNGLVLAAGEGNATIVANTYNGKTAMCNITVRKAPTALTISPETIVACEKDTVELAVAFGGSDEFANVQFRSSDEETASVSKHGVVSFHKIGTAKIYAETYNGLQAVAAVDVRETPTSVSFAHEDHTILKGDRAALSVVFDQGAACYTLTSGDESVVSFAEDGFIEAHKAGSTVITLEVPSIPGMRATCEIEVVEQLDGVLVEAAETTIKLKAQTELSYTLLPENAIGTGLVTFSSLNEEVATVDAATGIVTGCGYGTATIRATAGDGTVGEIDINVLGGERRMLIATYFGEVGDSGYLPFAKNNGNSMRDTFKDAVVEGQKYDIAPVMSNAPKNELFYSIDKHFEDATDDDVSVIYLCAHGSPSYGPTGEYAFSLRAVYSASDTAGYVTASELMDHLVQIKGKVIVIMDSCYSGGLIDCNKSRLDAEGGRISIISSSHRSTSSSYYNVSSQVKAVDYYTFALLEGLGFNESQGLGGLDRGWYTSVPPADADSNGEVTLSEMFSFAKPKTISYVKAAYGKSHWKGNVNQTPQSYLGANADVVLFDR